MLRTPSERIQVADLARVPYLNVLTYPRPDLRAARSRLSQLRRLGVTEVVFEGRTKVGRLGLVGMGTVGVVVKCTAGGEEVLALKVRRTDANRESMEREAELTLLANRVGVAPRLLAHTKDFILMEYVEGTELVEWLEGLAGRGRRVAAGAMVHSLLNQCRKLDVIGLDHGQLSNLRKHVIVSGGEPRIIDFESAGTGRTPKNVTTAAQYLFVGGRVSTKVKAALGVRDADAVLRALRTYKEGMGDVDYARLLMTLNLRSTKL